MDTVDIETSIVSHATAKPSRDLETAVLQEQARRWMEEEAPHHSLVTSRIVLAEARRGDADAANRRLALLSTIALLEDNPESEMVTDQLISHFLIPEEARLDAMHVASAALAGVQYLLTQNCRHIANAHVLPRLYNLLNELGLSGMLICTPEQFLGGIVDEEFPS